MIIYVTHSTNFDFHTELYAPLGTISGDEYTFILPHKDGTFINSKTIIPTCDLVLAEISHPSTGQGIELGWANTEGLPIVCIHKVGAKISSSLVVVSDRFIEYSSSKEMIEKLSNFLGPK